MKVLVVVIEYEGDERALRDEVDSWLESLEWLDLSWRLFDSLEEARSWAEAGEYEDD